MLMAACVWMPLLYVIIVELTQRRNMLADKNNVDCMLGYDADMMTVEYCRGFQ